MVCDLVAEMAWERLRSDPGLLCLHAAAVAFDDTLVVMPNARRAGKSTLAVALARLGHRLLTDDVLPVRHAPDRQTFVGIANGIAPRLRLPLPEGFSPAFHDWVGQDIGPANRQYKYLTSAPIAPGGTEIPLGAIVALDRQDDATPPRLDPIPREEALASLIQQNFARAAHSARILDSADRLTRGLPAFRLTYHSGEEAAGFLSTHPALQNLPIPVVAASGQPDQPSPLSQPAPERPHFDAALPYVQAPGVAETHAGADHFLADSSGQAIHRLNPGSAVIWRLLCEPADLAEVTSLLASLYEDTPPDQIRADSETVMRHLAETGLIRPAAPAP